MEGIIEANKRTILSRKNTSEEKSKQQTEWKKRRRNRQRMAKSAETTTLTRQEANAGAEEIGASNAQEKPLSPPSKRFASSKDSKNSGKLLMQSEAKMPSRGALMLSMARGFPVTSVFSKPAPQRQIIVKLQSQRRWNRKTCVQRMQNQFERTKPRIPGIRFSRSSW